MKIFTNTMTRTALFLALALSVQTLKMPTTITGPLINGFLFLAVVFNGTLSGVLIGLLTPWIALLQGIIPPPLAVAVPFIMLSNGILCTTFGLLRRTNQIMAFVIASILKFFFLLLIVKLILHGKIPAKAATVLTTPQLFTALAGAFIADIILRSSSIFINKYEDTLYKRE